MDDVLKGAGTSLLALGLPGILIMILLYACYRLFNLYTEIQEKRIDEARESVKTIEANTSALQTFTAILRDRKG